MSTHAKPVRRRDESEDFSDSDSDGEGAGRPSKKAKQKTATDLIIDEALAEEKARKEAKKGGPVKKQKDGKTLAEIEQEEGGPVKESLVGMAQVKRAANRKKDTSGKDDESTDIPTDVDKYEEKAEVLEEDGQKFTGFNLDEERETGYFDEDGNYVENKEKPDPAEKDAWMTSDEAKVVSDEVRRKIEERRKAEEEASKVRVAPLTDRQIAAMKAEMAQHMKAGETLTQALGRLGAGQQSQKALGKREKLKLQQQQQAGDKSSGGGGGEAAQVFARMTEIADKLLLEGEVDVYESTKEDFDKSAAMWLPKTPAAPAAGTGTGPAARAVDDDDDDMFAEDDSKASKPAAAKGPADSAAAPTAAATQNSQPATGASQGPGTEAAGPADVGVDYTTWPLKELKRFCKERGVDPDKFVEKGDLVAEVQRLAAAGPTTATGSGTPQAAYPVPLGYAYDPASGYYHNAEVGMYFDAASGYYYSNGTWYTQDPATGNFTPMHI